MDGAQLSEEFPGVDPDLCDDVTGVVCSTRSCFSFYINKLLSEDLSFCNISKEQTNPVMSHQPKCNRK